MENIYPRHPGTMNTFWHVKGVFDLCMRWGFVVIPNLSFGKYGWQGSLLVGSALRGVTFLEMKGRHQPLPKPLTQRTNPSPFLLSCHAWNHQSHPKPSNHLFFFRQQNAKMQGGHNRFPTSDVLNSKCPVDAPARLISVNPKGTVAQLQPLKWWV